MMKYQINISSLRTDGIIKSCKDCKLSQVTNLIYEDLKKYNCPIIGGLHKREYENCKPECCPLVEVEE